MFGLTRNSYNTITVIDFEYDEKLVKRMLFNGCIKIDTLCYEVAKEIPEEFTEIDVEDGIEYDTIGDCEINLGNGVSVSVAVYDVCCSDTEREKIYHNTIPQFEDAFIDACVEARIKRAAV